MGHNLRVFSLVGLFVGIIALGFFTLHELSPVPADMLTPAQHKLIELADFVVKGALGAIGGYAGAQFVGKADGA